MEKTSTLMLELYQHLSPIKLQKTASFWMLLFLSHLRCLSSSPLSFFRVEIDGRGEHPAPGILACLYFPSFSDLQTISVSQLSQLDTSVM